MKKKNDVVEMPKYFKLLNFTTKENHTALDQVEFTTEYLKAVANKDMIEVQLPCFSIVEPKELAVKNGVVYYNGMALEAPKEKVHPFVQKENEKKEDQTEQQTDEPTEVKKEN